MTFHPIHCARCGEQLRASDEWDVLTNRHVNPCVESPLNKIARDLSRELAQQFDAAIAQALDRHLGVGRWKLEDLKGHLFEVKSALMPGSWFLHDHTPLLWVGDLKTEIVDGQYRATRDVRWLS